MTREEFIEYLKGTGLHYNESNVEGYDGVYVHGIEYFKKVKHPRKYKNLYVREMRISNFGGMWYVRDNGYCSYVPEEVVVGIIERWKEPA